MQIFRYNRFIIYKKKINIYVPRLGYTPNTGEQISV